MQESGVARGGLMRADAIAQTLARNRDESFAAALGLLREASDAAYPGVTAAGLGLGARALASWDGSEWQDRSPSTSAVGVGGLVRIGQLEHTAPPDAAWVAKAQMPCVVPMFGAPREAHLILGASGPALEACAGAIQAAAFRLLASLGPGKVRLVGIDAPGLGAAFSALTTLHESIRGPMFWHDPRQIQAALDGLTTHISTVLQKYLRHDFADLTAYNRHAGQVAEAYRLLVVSGFPVGFNAEAAAKLLAIMKSGARCGVHVLMSQDLSQKLPHGFNSQELYEVSSTIAFSDSGETRSSVWGAHFAQGIGSGQRDSRGRGADSGGRLGPQLNGFGVRVRLDPAPPTELVQAVVKVFNPVVTAASRIEVPFRELFPPSTWGAATADALWTGGTTEKGIAVPIGRHGARDEMLLELGSEGTSPVHALVCGRTGSGKSGLLHAFICGTALAYPPSEVELYLLDFKEGVEFAPYRHLPHTRVIAMEAEREFGVSVLRGLAEKEIPRRAQLFGAAGVGNVGDLRQRQGTVLPRIVLVIDEFQVLFDRNDALKTRAAQLLDDLFRRGRSFGIHVILSSQSLMSVDLNASSLSQMGLRIALQMDEADSMRVLAKDNDEAKYLERPGEALYNAHGGLAGRNKKFQVAYVSRAEVETLVERLRALAPGQEPIVFVGSQPSALARNGSFRTLLQGPAAATVPRYYDLFVGEPTDLDTGHLAYRLLRQSRGNVLMAGMESGAAAMTLVSMLASFALRVPRGQGRIRLLNLVNADDPLCEAFEPLRALPLELEIGGHGDVDAFVAATHAAFAERLEAGRSGAPGGPLAPPEMLAIFGLQGARSLQKSGGFGKATESASQLKKVLTQGAGLGMHVVCWTDSWTNFGRVFETGELDEFGGRIVFRGGDAHKVLGGQASVPTFRRSSALLFDERNEDPVRKFRFYGDALAADGGWDGTRLAWLWDALAGLRAG